MNAVAPADRVMVEVTALADQLLRLQRRRRTVVEGTLLEDSAFRILWILADGIPRTLRTLASELDLEQSTINRQVNAAIAGGYLERFAVDGSASRMVRPTADGEAAYQHDGLIRAAVISAVLADLGPERSRTLIDALHAFNDTWDTVSARRS
jgi:DNA-binding MarR family transcriptional regulator